MPSVQQGNAAGCAAPPEPPARCLPAAPPRPDRQFSRYPSDGTAYAALQSPARHTRLRAVLPQPSQATVSTAGAHQWRTRWICPTVGMRASGADRGLRQLRQDSAGKACHHRRDCSRVRSAAVAGIAGELAGLAVAGGRKHRAGRNSGAQRTLHVPLPYRRHPGFLDTWFSPRRIVCRAGRRSRVPLRERQRGGYREAVATAATDINSKAARGRAWAIARAGPRPRLWQPLQRKPRAGPYRHGRLRIRSPAARAAFRPPAARAKVTHSATVNLPATRTSHAHCRLLRHRRLFRAGHVPRLLLDEKDFKLRRLRRRRTQYATSDLFHRHRRHLVLAGPLLIGHVSLCILQGSSCSSRLPASSSADFLRVVHLRARHNAGKMSTASGTCMRIYYGRSGRLLSSVRIPVLRRGVRGCRSAMGAILQTATGISLIPAALIASIRRWPIRGQAASSPASHRRRAVRHHRHRFTLCAYLAIDRLGGFAPLMSILYSTALWTDMKPWQPGPLSSSAASLPTSCSADSARRTPSQSVTPHQVRQRTAERAAHFRVHWIFFAGTTAAIGLASMAIQPDVKPDLAFTSNDILPPGITGLARVQSAARRHVHPARPRSTRPQCIYTATSTTSSSGTRPLRRPSSRQSHLSTLVVGGISINVAIIFQDVFRLMIYMFKL